MNGFSICIRGSACNLYRTQVWKKEACRAFVLYYSKCICLQTTNIGLTTLTIQPCVYGIGMCKCRPMLTYKHQERILIHSCYLEPSKCMKFEYSYSYRYQCPHSIGLCFVQCKCMYTRRSCLHIIYFDPRYAYNYYSFIYVINI